MDQLELDSRMTDMWTALHELGIPVSKRVNPHVTINTRARRRLGCCTYSAAGCVIEVSQRILDDPELLRLTLAHELLHTCPGCRNHGPRWKAWAQTASEHLGLDIHRTVPMEGESGPLRQEEVKYVLECQSCGARIERRRLSKAVKTPWRYRCRCGGKLKRLPDIH